MLRVLVLFFLFFEFSYSFNTKAFMVNKHGQIEHKTELYSLCVDKDSKFKKCQNGDTIFIQQDNLPLDRIRLYKIKKNKKKEIIVIDYNFMNLSDLEDKAVYSNLKQWFKVPDEYYKNFSTTKHNCIQKMNIKEEVVKPEKENKESTKETIIKKDLIIYIPLQPNIADEIQVSLVDVLNTYRSDEKYNEIDIRFGKRIVVSYDQEREYQPIYHLFLPKGLIQKNRQNYTFNVHELLKQDKEEYEKIIVFDTFDDCKNPYNVKEVFNLDTSRNCKKIKDVLDILKK